jgi:hypothetical protein
MKPSDIVNVLKGEVANLEDRYSTQSVVEEGKASDGIRELLKDLKAKPEVGLPLQGDIFNTITRGARKGKLYLRSAATGVGKAIPNSTIIPTPNGFKRADEIIVGDYLFDRLGNETLVLGVYPQGLRKVWEITFDDGRKAKCCEDHL